MARSPVVASLSDLPSATVTATHADLVHANVRTCDTPLAGSIPSALPSGTLRVTLTGVPATVITLTRTLRRRPTHGTGIWEAARTLALTWRSAAATLPAGAAATVTGWWRQRLVDHPVDVEVAAAATVEHHDRSRQPLAQHAERTQRDLLAAALYHGHLPSALSATLTAALDTRADRYRAGLQVPVVYLPSAANVTGLPLTFTLPTLHPSGAITGWLAAGFVAELADRASTAPHPLATLAAGDLDGGLCFDLLVHLADLRQPAGPDELATAVDDTRRLTR